MFIMLFDYISMIISKQFLIEKLLILYIIVSPGGSDGKESACNVEDLVSILRLGRSLGGGHGNHSSAWKIPMDRGAWWASPWGCKGLDMTGQLSTALLIKAFWLTVFSSVQSLSHFRLFANPWTAACWLTTLDFLFKKCL